MLKFYTNKMILVDGRQTYLLTSSVGDSGVLLCVSGPHTIVLHEHVVTELDGSELKLEGAHNIDGEAV